MRNPASRYAVVGVFVAETTNGFRVAVTGAAGSVFRWSICENTLDDRVKIESFSELPLSHDEEHDTINQSRKRPCETQLYPVATYSVTGSGCHRLVVGQRITDSCR